MSDQDEEVEWCRCSREDGLSADDGEFEGFEWPQLEPTYARYVPRTGVREKKVSGSGSGVDGYERGKSSGHAPLSDMQARTRS